MTAMGAFAALVILLVAIFGAVMVWDFLRYCRKRRPMARDVLPPPQRHCRREYADT